MKASPTAHGGVAPFFAAFVLSFSCAIPIPSLWANPADGVVTFGGAEFIGGNGNLTIRQTTEKAIINWADFSISRGELTEFIQPGSNAAILNRVVGGNPSALDGALKANGKVFLINPNGILVGPSGAIDVGGLVLSTLDISDEDFISGRDMLFKGTSGASVVNYGKISAIEGDVFLIGNSVANYGTIEAANGTVGLAAGSEVLITAEPNREGERVFVRAAAGPRGANGVENSGTIEAAAVELKAHGNLYALAINNSGSIRATGTSRRGGKVFLRSPGGTTTNTGSIEATVPGSAGGRILIESTDLNLGGSLSTDPEGDITLLSRVNLLPGATIGGQKLDDLLVDINKPDAFVPTDEMLREGGGQAFGTDAAIDRKTGKIIRGGRFADGPSEVVSSTKDGRVVIGMPGVTNESVVKTPEMASIKPVSIPPVVIQDDTNRPTKVDPMAEPANTGTASPAGTNTKPPVPVEAPTPPPGTAPRP
ncbi:MAG: filamentous hemagglutinin N-terminal domain-containing protein [Verrucomicrobiae bacterium]|nr:filamentous hemagglutinin N-terminal domain-containing protein [Verrucomicrobiae bacterium]